MIVTTNHRGQLSAEPPLQPPDDPDDDDREQRAIERRIERFEDEEYYERH